MSRINTNVASLRGLRNYNQANKLLDTSLTRLSTGLKINTGKDNPSGLIASETLRLQVTTIEQSIKNSNRANNVIATADGALGEIGGLLNQIRGLVQEGLNDGALSQTEKEANQLQIDSALSAINRISSNTQFAGDKLIDGSKAFVTSFASAAEAAKLSDFKISQAILGSSTSLDLAAEITSVAEKGYLRYSGGNLGEATTLEIGGSQGNEVIFLGDSSTVGDVRDAINGVTDSTGVTARLTDGYAQAETAESATAQLSSTGGGPSSIDVTYLAAGAGGNGVNIVINDDTTTDRGLTAVFDADSNTLTVNLAVNTGALVDATNTTAAIAGAIDAMAEFSATDDGGGGFIAAASSTALTGGTDAGSIVFNDIRADASAGAVTVDVQTNAGVTGGAISIEVDGTDITISADEDVTIEQIAAAINAHTDASALIEATTSGDADNLISSSGGQQTLDEGAGSILAIESQNYGSHEFVSVNVLSGTFATANTDGDPTGRDIGADIGAIINGQAAYGQGLKATLRTSTIDASLHFAEASNTVGETATVTINGGGSLFQIGEDVSSAGQIGVGIEAMNTARLGGISGKLYELGTGNGKSLLDVGQGGVSGADLVGIIDEALERVTTLRGRLGSIQKNVIETNINTLGVALENISEARSQIVDTDFAVETAAMTKAQVLQQTGISVLAIANQNPQQVLSLLG